MINIRELRDFIHSKRETDFLDFKRIPHSNNALLLHDILCLANSVSGTDKYLIIGVSDPKEGCEIVGVKNLPNRKSQSDLVDFLRSKSFAGGIRPEIELHTFTISNKEIDVLMILDRPKKPYILIEDYNLQGKQVKANYIYTRILDTNTPINSSADIHIIETMWKERFGLSVSPANRFKFILLEPQNWELDFGNKNYAYYKPEPQYRIEVSEPKSGHEPYQLLMINPEFDFGTLKLLYHSTIMYEAEYIWLDGFRLISAAPSTALVELTKAKVYYYYLNLMTIDGLLHYLFREGQLNCESRGHDPNFIYFRNEKEQQDFETYIQNNETKFWEIEPEYISIEANEKLKIHKHMGNVVNLVNVNRIYQMWQGWYDINAHE